MSLACIQERETLLLLFFFTQLFCCKKDAARSSRRCDACLALVLEQTCCAAMHDRFWCYAELSLVVFMDEFDAMHDTVRGYA